MINQQNPENPNPGINQQSQPQDLTALWEQMGSSTGNFLGSLIGYTTRNSLQAYEQMVINPLRQFNQSSGANNNQKNVSANQSPAPGIREQTWQEMGRQFGESIGTSIGMSMDLLISTLEKSTSTMRQEKP